VPAKQPAIDEVARAFESGEVRTSPHCLEWSGTQAAWPEERIMTKADQVAHVFQMELAVKIHKAMGIGVYEFGEDTVVARSEVEAVDFYNRNSRDDATSVTNANERLVTAGLLEQVPDAEGGSELLIVCLVEQLAGGRVPGWFTSTYF
jgi:hypothetical protein